MRLIVLLLAVASLHAQPLIRDRMARLGGAVEIYGDPGGTTLIATLPIERPSAANDGGTRSAA